MNVLLNFLERHVSTEPISVVDKPKDENFVKFHLFSMSVAFFFGRVFSRLLLLQWEFGY